MGGRPRRGRTITWLGPVAVVLGVLLALSGNALTNALPAEWSWLHDWRLLSGVVGALLLLALLLDWWRARREASQEPADERPAPSVVESPDAVQVNHSPASANAAGGGMSFVNSPVTINAAPPAPLPEPKPGQVVVGEIPREPVPFQERPALAEKVDATLAGERMAVVCALAGGRGVGKTQLAAALARRRIADGCPLVGWISGETTSQYLSGLAAIAERLGVADPEGDSVRSARRFREHLEGRTEPALLVVDNAVDPDEVAKFLPTTGTTQVLVTTTDHAFRNLGRLVDVDVYTRPESLDYLREVTGRDDALADVLAEELGDLPLALTQAAAVIVSKPWTYRRYLEELERVAVDQVLRRQDGQAYPKGAAEAILLALDAVESADPTGMVTRVLTVLSVLAPDGVPRGLLARLPGGGDASRVEDAVEQCVRSSMLTVAGDNDAVVLHRLIARVLRDRSIARGELGRVLDDALGILEDVAFPPAEAWRRREEGRDLVGQLAAVWAAGRPVWSPAMPGDGRTERVLGLRGWAVRQLTKAADPSGALLLGRQVLADSERVLGEDHRDTLAARRYLAFAYRSAGRLGEAILLHERNLADFARVLGGDHPDTLAARNYLAFAYESAGRLGEAIALFEGTIADSERVLGGDHPDTLGLRNYLAFAYRSAGRLGEAIALFEGTLAERERALGGDHPDTLTSRKNLAFAYQLVGRLGEAIPLYERTLTACRQAFGADHPLTKSVLTNLDRARGA